MSKRAGSSTIGKRGVGDRTSQRRGRKYTRYFKLNGGRRLESTSVEKKKRERRHVIWEQKHTRNKNGKFIRKKMGLKMVCGIEGRKGGGGEREKKKGERTADPGRGTGGIGTVQIQWWVFRRA